MQLILRNELTKAKNTPALWITLIGGIFLPVLLGIAYLNEWQKFIPKTGENPWFDYYGRLINGLCICTPLFICLVIALVFNVEHKALGWKLLFTLPVSKSKTFLYKYFMVVSIVVLYFLLFLVTSVICGMLLGWMHPQLGFLRTMPDTRELMLTVSKAFLCNLGIIAIQFWLSFRIRHVITSLGIGIGAVIIGLFAKDSSNAHFLAYVDPFKMIGYYFRPHVFWESYVVVSIVYLGIIIILSYLDFTKRFNG